MASPTSRNVLANRRGGDRRNSKPPRFLPLPPHAQYMRPFTMPDHLKRAAPAGCPISLDPSAAPVEIPFFTSLNYDIRRMIYDVILQEAGPRQHVFCPSVVRNWPTGELNFNYLRLKKCDDAAFEAATGCGHWQCVCSLALKNGVTENGFSLRDLLALMKTCKFGYLEVSEFFYRSVTFTFSTFQELHAFVDRVPAVPLSRVRSMAFIAHMPPMNPQACQRFLDGEYFVTEAGENDALLFTRVPNLEVLHVTFFPSIILAMSQKLYEVVEPLRQLPEKLDITLRIPRMEYGNTSVVSLPISSRLPEGEGRGRFTIKRPSMRANDRVVMGDCREHMFAGPGFPYDVMRR